MDQDLDTGGWGGATGWGNKDDDETELDKRPRGEIRQNYVQEQNEKRKMVRAITFI